MSGTQKLTLFLLLLLFAIPAGDCSAQTPPPPVDQHAFERVSPTFVKRLATRFSLGAFAGRFEETRLGAVRDAVGEGTIQHQGDAGDSIYWLCYRRAQHRLWVVSNGEMGGPDHRVTEIVEELAEKDTEASTDCAIVPEKFGPLVFDGKPVDEAQHRTCWGCHEARAKSRDYVFTRLAP